MSGPSPLRRWIARHSTSPPIELLRRGAWRVADLLQAEDHDIRRNGEAALLARLSGARTVLDVGAHVGDWTALALAACPDAVVHAFELSSDTRAVLRRRFRDSSRVVVASTGLLDEPGPVAVKTYRHRSVWTSIVDYPHDDDARWVDEAVVRGDDYLAARSIVGVDVLKVDAEGADLAVLRSFGGSLRDGLVAVVQFEHGYAGAICGTTLARFRALLEPFGYRLGRLRAKDIDWRPLLPTDEHFFGPNYVAVHRSAVWALDALTAPQVVSVQASAARCGGSGTRSVRRVPQA